MLPPQLISDILLADFELEQPGPDLVHHVRGATQVTDCPLLPRTQGLLQVSLSNPPVIDLPLPLALPLLPGDEELCLEGVQLAAVLLDVRPEDELLGRGSAVEEAHLGGG